jgi:hypothetical protein
MHCNSSLQSSGSNSCTNFVDHIFFTLWIHHSVKLLIESEVRSLGFAPSCIIFLPFFNVQHVKPMEKVGKVPQLCELSEISFLVVTKPVA